MFILFVLIWIFQIGFSLESDLEHKSELEFIQIASSWRKPNLPIEDCLFFNFGYEKHLPYAQVAMDLQQETDISFLTRDIEAPSGCFIILVAGKFLKQVDAVMKRMDDIAESNNFVPLLAFIFAKDADIDDSLRLHANL